MANLAEEEAPQTVPADEKQKEQNPIVLAWDAATDEQRDDFANRYHSGISIRVKEAA
jgi:hypothetical protein